MNEKKLRYDKWSEIVERMESRRWAASAASAASRQNGSQTWKMDSKICSQTRTRRGESNKSIFSSRSDARLGNFETSTRCVLASDFNEPDQPSVVRSVGRSVCLSVGRSVPVSRSVPR